MLERAKSLKGYKLYSLDGEIGSVQEFYFGDCDWNIRYLIADTGTWLTDKQVLIPPQALKSVDKEQRIIIVNLTRKQIEDSPLLDKDKPVSRRIEELLYSYYDWPAYWSDVPVAVYPYFDRNDPKLVEDETKIEKAGDPHLRSTKELSGYDIAATDGDIGHAVDFIIDDEAWMIRYLVVSTRNWVPGKKVLISTKWIDHIKWEELKFYINLRREEIRQSPEYTEDSAITREYESDLHEHYHCSPYWDNLESGKENAVKS